MSNEKWQGSLGVRCVDRKLSRLEAAHDRTYRLPEVILLIAFIPFLLVMVALYFLPTFIAHKRRHANRTAITILNVLAGWTVLGWLGALVWSATSRTTAQVLPSASRELNTEIDEEADTFAE